jgi:NADH-quinone oxidoreductase subunit F
MKLSTALINAGVSLHGLEESIDRVLFLGVELFRDDPSAYEAVLNANSKYQLAPFEDSGFENYIKYEVGTEEGVLALLCASLYEQNESFKHIFGALDEGYISAESNVGEEEAKILAAWLKKEPSVWIFGAEWEDHPQAQEIAKWVALMSAILPIRVVIIGQDPQMAAAKAPVQPNMDIELESFDGTVVYACAAKDTWESQAIIASSQFAIAAKAKDGAQVRVQTPWKDEIRRLHVKDAMKGTIALLPFATVPSGYRYAKSRITPVG